MVSVEIRGKEFPLCLTVAAVDAINEKCGGLGHLINFLDGVAQDGSKNLERSLCNTAWMLGLLLQEGEEHRLMLARFDGTSAVRRVVPDSEGMCHYLTLATAKKYRKAVLDSVYESMTQDIEAAHSKNGQNAGQE